jgi:putative membrane protein
MPQGKKIRAGICFLQADNLRLQYNRRSNMQAEIPEDKLATEYLAAERTFLAWVRTSIAVITLGFVVAKFGLWMRELTAHLDPRMPIHSTGMSLPMGEAMMAFGGILVVLAALHYHAVNRAIERGEVRANRGLIVTITVVVAALAGLMMVYMLLAAESA